VFHGLEIVVNSVLVLLSVVLLVEELVATGTAEAVKFSSYSTI
jgi:hypothetical protein